MLCAKFGWNWPSGSWEKDQIVESLQITVDGHFYKINFNSSKDASWIEHDTSFKKNEFQSPNLGCFVPSLVEIVPMWFCRRWKLDKFTDRQVVKQTDNRWSEKLACTFSSGELTCKTELNFHILAIIKDNLKSKIYMYCTVYYKYWFICINYSYNVTIKYYNNIIIYHVLNWFNFLTSKPISKGGLIFACWAYLPAVTLISDALIPTYLLNKLYKNRRMI